MCFAYVPERVARPWHDPRVNRRRESVKPARAKPAKAKPAKAKPAKAKPAKKAPTSRAKTVKASTAKATRTGRAKASTANASARRAKPPLGPASVRTRWIGTDGGPLVLVPDAKRLAWSGSFVPGTDGDFTIETSRGPFAFHSDYDFANPRTEYERACGINGFVGQMDVAGASALVLADEALETTWRPLRDGGLFARVHTAEPEAYIEAELADLPVDGEWSDTHVTLNGGTYWLMDALDHGAKPQREPVRVSLGDGSYHVLTATISTASVAWVCIRLRHI